MLDNKRHSGSVFKEWSDLIQSGLGCGNTISSADWLQSVLEDKERVAARTSSDWLQSDVEEVEMIG